MDRDAVEPRCVVFDLDGALLDHESASRAGLASWVEECVSIGDDGIDILAARRAGWRAIHLDRRGERREPRAMVRLAELSEHLRLPR